jgi:hypothetical protein
MPAQVDATPWPDVLDLLDYWADNPPVHQLLKGFMGIKGRKKKAKAEPATKAIQSDMQSIVNLFNGG